jgi:hypothetical protein
MAYFFSPYWPFSGRRLAGMGWGVDIWLKMAAVLNRLLCLFPFFRNSFFP